MSRIRESRCSFAVVKVRVGNAPWYLMREDTRWRDFNLIGGHERDRDAGNMATTARRELLEEVPTLRAGPPFSLTPLAPEFAYGPVPSKSKNCLVRYLVSFFLVGFELTPGQAMAGIGPRSANVWVRERDLLDQHGHRVSQLVQLLGSRLPGGLESIPLSWPDPLHLSLVSQEELPLSWPAE